MMMTRIRIAATILGLSLTVYVVGCGNEEDALTSTIVAQSGPDDSLFLLANPSQNANLTVWQLDFKDGQEIHHEQILTLTDSKWISANSTGLLHNRYAISTQGLVLDLAQGQIIRPPNGRLLGISDNHLYCQTHPTSKSGDYALHTVDFTTGIQQIIPSAIPPGFSQPSPDGKHLLRITPRSQSVTFFRIPDATPIEVPLAWHLKVPHGTSLTPAPSALWLDHESILCVKSNHELVRVFINGTVEPCLTIPPLDPTAHTKLARRYQLLRDPSGTIIYDAGLQGAFQIDVESQQWSRYSWRLLGHEFATKMGNDPATIRHRERDIGQVTPTSQLQATEHYLAELNSAGLRCWSTHRKQWQTLTGLNASSILGWINHRQEASLTEAKPLSRDPILAVHEWSVHMLGHSHTKVNSGQPVIHVYGGANNDNVQVALTDRITGLTQPQHWEISLRNHPIPLPEPPSEDHWLTIARQVPGRFLQTNRGNHRSLTYAANQLESRHTPVQFAYQNDELHAHWSQFHTRQDPDEDQWRMLIIINDQGHYRWTARPGVGQKPGGHRLPSEDYPHHGSQINPQVMQLSEFTEIGVDNLLVQFRSLWLHAGMTVYEANAITQIWQHQVLNTPGILALPTPQRS